MRLSDDVSKARYQRVLEFGLAMNRLLTLMLLSILLFAIPSHAVESRDVADVEQFGVVFNEVVIADASDDLDDPRDLEFHPGRANELWIANRATDSITIVHDTGLETQYSENRQDSNRNHFLEEVSSIAFGAYHPEFDWQWGSAQETGNTFCGQIQQNFFMGPTLWPSSLNHFAIENQNNGNGLLGSHIDMNHESPYGVGIAHDYDNVYWYNDGHYGELVRYDFQQDHDTGEEDHSDAIIRRYADITLTHSYGIPGHMVMDKSSGILYIADAGANRVLWVNTDDASYQTEDIMNDPSRLEPLAEYSEITGIEWGILDTGLNRPSGIALEGNQLFVSTYGDGKITAYELDSDGKGVAEADSIQTSATSIMGLEIGPDGHLYYVDNGQDEVVRIDPLNDEDGDGIGNEIDNCPFVPNAAQTNYDGDAKGDVCDEDDDNDSVLDDDDDCQLGNLSWVSSPLTDHDMDGCADLTEDIDDDNDMVVDDVDRCPTGDLEWASTSATDYDMDGCRDAGEDLDDDDDRICDGQTTNNVWACSVSTTQVDECPMSAPTFSSIAANDADQDGCEDATEDLDDDNDGIQDAVDDCPESSGSSSLGLLLGCLDTDQDGYADSVDVFPTESTQWADSDADGFGDETDGVDGDSCPNVPGLSFEDRNGCDDSDKDGWSNPDSNWGIADGADAFASIRSQHADQDGDNFGDSPNGFEADVCPLVFGTSIQDRFGCLDSDGDGWSDEGDAFDNDSTQYADDDMDGYGDSPLGNLADDCPGIFGLSSQERLGCPDSDEDGWDDYLDAFAEDDRFWSDIDDDGYPDQVGTNISDDCPEEKGSSTRDRIGCVDTDGDGWSDEGDSFPADAERYLAADSSSKGNIITIISIVVIVSLLLGMFTVSRRRSNTPKLSQPLILPPIAQLTPSAPPLPPEGLPAGWTMDQWAWYGEDYLKNQ